MSDFSKLQVRKSGGIETLLGRARTELDMIALARPEKRRTKIWEISQSLHCSIIGTCLTAAELRQFFIKFGDKEAKTATDHIIHSGGVRTAGQRDVAGKLLHKALDRRHQTAVKRFAKASTPAEVRELWLRALKEGDIPGAYWAVLTHPETNAELVQEVFGEVHMLSHMVGTSNRLDLARLRKLEQELGERDEKIGRQEVRLQTAAQDRAELLRNIEKLESGLAQRQAMDPIVLHGRGDEADALHRKLADEKARSAALAVRLSEAESRMRNLEEIIAGLEVREASLQNELTAFEKELGAGAEDSGPQTPEHDLNGKTLLYVGGRPGQVEKLRAITRRRGGKLVTHDGGVEDNSALLPGLVSQAEVTLFPVDCISHDAAGRLKKLCREAGKPFVPLRTASLASFIAAIRREDYFESPKAAAE